MDYSEETYYDDYYYEEDSNEPLYDLTYDDPGIDIDVNEIINYIDESATTETENAPELCPDDNNIAFSTSINQSREFISRNLGINPSSLRQHHVPGLIILRLEDFCIIRNE